MLRVVASCQPKSFIFLASSCVVFVAASLSCAGDDEQPVRAAIETRLVVPRGVLDKATGLELRVLEGGTCDSETGLITGDIKEIAKKALGTTGCAAPAKFCGDISVAKSATPRVFEAKATDGGAKVLAVGCTTATVDQDAVPIAIKMFRFLAPAVCGNGTIEPTEQCEPGGTAVCDDECQSKEILLSVGNATNNTNTGKSGDKTDPFFLWPTGSGDTGRFLAFYTDRNSAGAGNTEIGLRVMGADLAPVSSPPALTSASILLPNGGAFPPTAEPLRQAAPQAAILGGRYYVVFQDDNSPGGLDIHMRTMNNLFVSAEPTGSPLQVNGGAQGEPNIQQSPSIAASDSRLFIAWEDAQQGKIVGRGFTPPSTFGNQNDISSGNGNTKPQVASTGGGKGFVTVWKSGTGIKLRAINADGTPSGGEQTVNASGAGADGGKVASLPDGRFAVVWSAGGDIFVQRYDNKAQPIPGDQAQPINDVVKDADQTQPTIAALPNGAYVVAWIDAASGHVHARYLGGDSGFLFNNVNGQSSEFQASKSDNKTRATPTIAVGGLDPFIAIGWEDKSTSGAGIVVRRFPLPTD